MMGKIVGLLRTGGALEIVRLVVMASALPVLCLHAADAPAVPGLLFYASFDGAFEERFDVVQCPSQGQSVPGEAGLFPNAEVAAGNRVPTNLRRVEFVPQGRFGGAARVSEGGVLAFDATGNMLSQRGTAAFWVQVEQPLWSVPFRQGRMSRIFKVSDRQHSLRGFGLHKLVVNSVAEQLEWRYGDREPVRFGREHEYEIIETRWGTDFARWTFSEHRDHVWAPEEEWQPGEWHHVALVWDAAVGRRLYIDGQRVGSWEFLEHRVPSLDKISLGPRVGPGHAAVQPLGLLYDELYIFDYPLESAAVERLARDNEPPSQRLEPDEATRRARFDWLVAHHDLHAQGVPVYPSGGLRARQVMVDSIRNVRARRHEVMDGKLHLSWPVLYKDYGHAPLPYVLTLEWDEEQRFNYARLRGSFAGNLLRAGQPLATFVGKTFTQRLHFDEPLEARGVLEMQRHSGSINQLDLYELLPWGSDAGDSESQQSYFFRSSSAAESGAAGAMAVARYPPEDATILGGLAAGDAAADSLALAAGRRVHLISAPVPADMLVESVTLELALEDFDGETVALLQGHDPLIMHRELFEFDVRFDPAALPEPLLLEIELREPVGLRAGHTFWVSVLFDRAGSLRLGSGATRMHLHAHPEQQRALPNLEQVLCDLFLHHSEPQVWRNRPEPRAQFSGIDEVMTLCEHLMHFDPGNRTAQSIYSWILSRARVWQTDLEDPLAGLEVEDPGASGPEWAVWSRASLLALREHLDWWIGERQADYGEFGGGVNDDSTMVPDWVPFAMIHDPGGQYRDSLRRLAELAFEVNMPAGLTLSPKGTVHAFEQGMNIIPFLPLLYYGNPHYLEMLMKAARWYDGHLTATTPTGKRHFRSGWMSAEAVPTDGVDTGPAILFKPGRYLAWYNRNPEVTRVLREWMDAWLSYGTDPAHPFGEHAIDFATGQPRGPFHGNGIWHHLYWLYELTRDDAYARPVVEGLRATGGRLPKFSVRSWEDWRRLIPDAEVDELVLGVLRQDRFEPGAAARRAGLIRSLQDSVLHMRKYLPMHTWVGQSTDRVGLRHATAQSMALGGLPTKAKRLGHHYHAVSWEGADYDVARFVVAHAPDRLRVLLYSFHEDPQDIIMRVWRLDHGRYRVRAGVDRTGDELADAYDLEREQILYRHEPIALRVPPQQVYVLEVEQIEPMDEDIGSRPDLAMAPGDAVVDGGVLRVTVYNIGGAEAPPALVRLERNGGIVAEQMTEAIPAPLELYPRYATVEFAHVEITSGMAVHVDPDHEIPEITTVNNRILVTP